jgi:pimeloyl-ACP methyl ester carboxylesterase
MRVSLSLFFAIGIAVWVVFTPVRATPNESWLLLHGIWPGSGWDWQKTLYWLKQREPNASIFLPTLNGRAGLFQWAENIVQFVESQGLLEQETRLHIIAHSFGGTATLFLLRTAYELGNGDLSRLIEKLDCSKYWGNALKVCQELLEGWRRLLFNEGESDRWRRTAHRIESVALYHPALRGACGACMDIWGFGGRTTGAMCLLEEIASWLWEPIDKLTWAGQKRILNLYGALNWGLSLCGLTQHDIALSLDQQQLRSKDQKPACAENYREIHAGAHSHMSFIYRWNVAKDLVERVRVWLKAVPDRRTECSKERP